MKPSTRSLSLPCVREARTQRCTLLGNQDSMPSAAAFDAHLCTAARATVLRVSIFSHPFLQQGKASA